MKDTIKSPAKEKGKMMVSPKNFKSADKVVEKAVEAVVKAAGSTNTSVVKGYTTNASTANLVTVSTVSRPDIKSKQTKRSSSNELQIQQQTFQFRDNFNSHS